MHIFNRIFTELVTYHAFIVCTEVCGEGRGDTCITHLEEDFHVPSPLSLAVSQKRREAESRLRGEKGGAGEGRAALQPGESVVLCKVRGVSAAQRAVLVTANLP